MKAPKDVCNFTISRVLKELGFIAPSKYMFYDGVVMERKKLTDCIPTFTLHELLNILPRSIQHYHNEHSEYDISLSYSGNFNLPMVYYQDNDLEAEYELLQTKGGSTFENACGKMIIWLIKNGYKDQLNVPYIEVQAMEELPCDSFVDVWTIGFERKLLCTIYANDPHIDKGISEHPDGIYDINLKETLITKEIIVEQIQKLSFVEGVNFKYKNDSN